VLSVVAFAFQRFGIVTYIGFMLAILAAVLLSPALSFWLSRALRPILAGLRPVEGALAADSLIQAPRRTSGTIAALMLSLALVISLGGLARSSYDSLAEWMRIALNPDFFVTTAETLSSRSFVFPGSLADGLRAIEGVAEVQPVRSVRVMVKKAPIMVIAIDVGAVAKHVHLPPVEGNSEEMYRLAAEEKGVVVSANFARLHDAHMGEVLEIPAPAGILRLPIVGVVDDFSDQQGTLLVNRDLFVRYWHDDSVNVFRVYVTPGADAAEVRQRILQAFGGQQRLFVLTNREVRDFITKLTDQWFGLTNVQTAVAVLVAILGIVNALTVSITDRRRELGVLQAVGGLRNQIRHTIWMEAIAIGIIGVVLGLLLGAVQLFYTIEIARRDLVGISIGYAYPFQTALILIPVILGSALLAALGPAESAVRGSLIEALEYE
jgi:putative ABC transport system permease protein